MNDIVQSSDLNDCYLLTNLMGLARSNPSFIKNFIKIKNAINDMDARNEGCKHMDSNGVEILNSVKSKETFSVTKKEEIKWETFHKALWPVIIEIAYAKFLCEKSNCETMNLRGIYGSYGRPTYVMRHLTGKSSKYAEYVNNRMGYERIKNYKSPKYSCEEIYKKLKDALIKIK